MDKDSTQMERGRRAGGLLLHPSSLPSPYGIGDLGPAALEMAAFIKKAGLHCWQFLPLAPTSPGLGNSPYSAFSAFAGNPLLISPDLMARDGWLGEADLASARQPDSDRVDFEKTIVLKQGLLDLAFERAAGRLLNHQPFLDFAWRNGAWLNDFAFFMAAKEFFGGRSWLAWPEELRRRDDRALHRYGTDLARPILKVKFAQFLFHRQLTELKGAANSLGVSLIGDAAIYVNHDSSDVWANQELFFLDQEGRSTVVAGVPPDYFAPTGQLWGSPIFNWPRHRETGFDWWASRLAHDLDLYDRVRLDHFRAFAGYWEVSARAATAAEGCWRPGPGAGLFEAARARHPLNLIAEDLGVITPDVTALRRGFGWPGMRVLQFAFGPDLGCSTHAPYRIEPDNVVFSGTHDNNTSRGWFRRDAGPLERRQLADLAGFEVDEHNAAWALIRLAWLSPAALAVGPLQDFLNLDEAARMNIPGTATGNWAWKLPGRHSLTPALADRMAELSALAGRDDREYPNTLGY